MATPLRNIRVDDARWTRWRAIAAARGITATDLIILSVEEALGEETMLKPDAPTHHDRQRDRYSRESVEATEAGFTPGRKVKGGGARTKVGGASGFGDLARRDVTPQFKKAPK